MSDLDIAQALDDSFEALDSYEADLRRTGFTEDAETIRESRHIVQALRTALDDPSTLSFLIAQVERIKERQDRIREIDDTVVD